MRAFRRGSIYTFGAVGLYLGIVPATLSRVLARIERKVGVQLFDRTSRGLRLNEFGRLYYGAAQKSLNELSDVQAQIADLANPDRGDVRLSHLESAGAWFADEFLGPFRRLSQNASPLQTSGLLRILTLTNHIDVHERRVELEFTDRQEFLRRNSTQLLACRVSAMIDRMAIQPMKRA